MTATADNLRDGMLLVLLDNLMSSVERMPAHPRTKQAMAERVREISEFVAQTGADND